MKKVSKSKSETDLRQEYDFSRGARGKYAKRFREGTNIVVLDPDVARVFSDSKSVNGTLRALMDIARRNKKTGA